MQVLLNIPDNYFEDECSPAFAYRERAKIEKEYNLKPVDEVEVVNIGPGPIGWLSWPPYLLPGIFFKSQDKSKEV